MPEGIVIRDIDIDKFEEFEEIETTKVADNSRGSSSITVGFRYYADSLKADASFEIKVTKVKGSSAPVKFGVTLNNGKNLYCKDNNTCIYDGRKGNTNSLYIFFEVPKGEKWEVVVSKI